jgi:hypothetical protein
MTSRKQFHLAFVSALTPLLFLVSEVSASEWHPFGLQGIEVRSLAAAPGRLCAGTAGRGVFCLDLRSKPSGWQSLGPEGTTITGLWFDPARPELIFAAASPSGVNVLFRSFDAGRTWQDLGPNIPATTYAKVHNVQGVSGSDTVYASGGAVWRSDDLGETWKAHNPTDPDGAQVSNPLLDVAPTDARTIWTGGDLLFTFMPVSFVSLSRDGSETWTPVLSTGPFDWTPVSDISASPRLDGAALIGLGGSVRRTLDHGASFRSVLQSPVNFLVDWGGRAGNLAFAAGTSSFTAFSEAWLSRDMGENWSPITGTRLGTLKINDLEADERLAGLAFVATNDGVYAFFGAGGPLCHDARRGVDEALLWLGECPPIMSPGPVIQGDAIVASSTALHADSDHVDLGAVYCVIENSDVAFETIDLPDPPVGEFFMILARQEGDVDYGVSSDGLPRRPSTGDCN